MAFRTNLSIYGRRPSEPPQTGRADQKAIQKVGNRRRIAFQDVLKLKETLRKRSNEAFNKLAEIDEELGIE
jgi:hypothetical protein